MNEISRKPRANFRFCAIPAANVSDCMTQRVSPSEYHGEQSLPRMNGSSSAGGFCFGAKSRGCRHAVSCICIYTGDAGWHTAPGGIHWRCFLYVALPFSLFAVVCGYKIVPSGVAFTARHPLPIWTGQYVGGGGIKPASTRRRRKLAANRQKCPTAAEILLDKTRRLSYNTDNLGVLPSKERCLLCPIPLLPLPPRLPPLDWG